MKPLPPIAKRSRLGAPATEVLKWKALAFALAVAFLYEFVQSRNLRHRYDALQTACETAGEVMPPPAVGVGAGEEEASVLMPLAGERDPEDFLAFQDNDGVVRENGGEDANAMESSVSSSLEAETSIGSSSLHTSAVSSDKKSIVTIITGTHVSAELADTGDETKQHATCRKLAEAMHGMWSAWDVKSYLRYKVRTKQALQAVAEAGESCTLSGSRTHSILWTFPMTWRPDAECDVRTKSTLAKRSYIREKTKVYVNWFLLRPDLVTLHNMASALAYAPAPVRRNQLEVRYVVVVGHDPLSASFAREGCPRFNTVLEKRDVYKERMLMVNLADVQHQLDRIKASAKAVFVCSRASLPRGAGWGGVDLASLRQFAPALTSLPPPGSECGARPNLHSSATHMGSLTLMRLFSGGEGGKLKKTVFTGPRLVFVAGLEGVGHHVFSLLGRKHTTRALYDALTEYLCDSAWTDDSQERYGPAREKLATAIKAIKTDTTSIPAKDGSGVYFLNTVWTLRDVNMYSYPWGGPRCFLKRYARVLCNIDLVELARVAQESAGVDFRVIHLTRSVGAAVVSASLHRPFGTLVSETLMLAASQSLLLGGLDTLDEAFTVKLSYEDLMNHPEASTDKIARHIGVPKEHAMYAHMLESLKTSALEHPVGDGSKWKEEVDVEQLQFMSDILGL